MDNYEYQVQNSASSNDIFDLNGYNQGKFFKLCKDF